MTYFVVSSIYNRVSYISHKQLFAYVVDNKWSLALLISRITSYLQSFSHQTTFSYNNIKSRHFVATTPHKDDESCLRLLNCLPY